MFSPLLPAPFPPQNTSERDALLGWIRGVSLVYGPWQTFKRLFKEVEAAYSGGQRETEIFAAILARIDNVPFVDESADRSQTPPIVKGNFTALQVANGLLYALVGAEDLVVYDLSSPLEPREIFRYSPPVSAGLSNPRLWVEGQRLVYGNSNQLRVFSLEDPLQPRFLFESGIPKSHNIALLGASVFVVDSQNFRVLNWPAPGTKAFTEAGRIAAQYSYALIAKPGLIGLSHWDSGRRRYAITFFDVTNPNVPIQVSQIHDQNPSDWKFLGDTLVRIADESLVFTDLSNPKSPREISNIRISGARTFHIVGHKIYVACSQWGQQNGRYGYECKLRIIDISNLYSPRLVGEFETAATQMADYGDLLYVGHGGLHILDVSDVSRLQKVGQRPKNATFGYLKRRSRRFLRILAEADIDAYIALADALLREAGQNRDSLDLDCNWTSAELTFGGGQRWHQKSHGRGAYAKRGIDFNQGAQFVLKRREERASQAWDAHLDIARNLWAHPHLAWQTQEMALKILRSHGEDVAPDNSQTARFLWSNSPSLLKFAARYGLARLSEQESRAYGPLVWVANARQRRDVLTFLESQPDLKSQTATDLATLLGQNAVSGLSRRVRDVALLMAARFDLSDLRFSADGALPAIPLILASAEAPLRTLGLNFCRRLSAISVINALGNLPQIQPAHREGFIDSLAESASRATFSPVAIDQIVRHADGAIRDAAWHLIDVSRTPAETLRAVWIKLFLGLRREPIYEGERYRSKYLGEGWIESAPLQSAVHSESALMSLGRCGLKSSDVIPKFGPNFYSHHQNSVSPATWAAFSLILPAETVVEVVLNAPGWNLNDGAWRQAWVRANTPHPDKLVEFWNAIQMYLESNKPATLKHILRERTFEQSEVAATFGGAASRLSPTLLMSLIGAVPENLWLQWRLTLLQKLQEDALTREAFWNAARQSPALETGFLKIRLLEDEDFAATFGQLETDALEADNPAFAPLVLAWLRARETTLKRESWIEAALHPLPGVRDFALSQLKTIGLDVPGALRLLESRLPPSIAFGRDWFMNREEHHLETALALCDSPQLSVRAIGREFIAAHFELLLQAGLIGYLQENPNAEMQGFVASQLKQHPQLTAPDFDRAVLRSRQRARRAKTLIQERTIEGLPLADDRTLLEIARGRTARDSEWALTQLARRLLDGVEVEGVEMGSGVGV